MLNNFFIIFVARENKRLKLAFAIPTGTPITIVKSIIDIPPLAAEKKIKALSNNQRK